MSISISFVHSLLMALVAINGLTTGASARGVARSMAACSSAPYQLQSSPVNINNTGTQNISLQANCGFTWNVTSANDVTAWFVDCNDVPIFSQKEGVAQAVTVDGNLLTIALDASKIAGFTTNGPSTLTLQPPSTSLSGGQTVYIPFNAYVGSYTVPKLNIISTITGSAYTHGKSTLKKFFGFDVTYDADTDAKLLLELPGLDDSKIGSDNATVSLIDGDGYYTSEYILNATNLKEPFINGRTSYQLHQGDLVINMGSYPLKDPNSGREWSCLGGDGQGNYIFHLEVAGITYNGLPVAAQTFRIHIYIHGYNYGYNSTSDANVKYGNGTTVEPVIAPLSSKVSNPPEPGATPIFTWVGDGNEPNLVDSKVDDFYITWPAGTDASELEACDITIILLSSQGDTLTLEAGRDFVISTSGNETQIAITYLNWVFEPVYNTLSITVDKTRLSGADVSTASLTSTYEIASVYVYLAQQGGGGTTIDGTVTAYSFYGLGNITNVNQITKPANYTLTTTVNGTEQYYAEDENGTGILVDTLAAASAYDGNGVQDKNIQLIGNTVYVTTRVNVIVIKQINGSPVNLTKAYAGGQILTPSEVDSYLTGLPGYIIPPATPGAELAGPQADQFDDVWIYHEKWAWQPSIAIGFHGIDILPYTGKFEWTLAPGSSQQFTASAWPIFSQAAASSVSWSMIGNTSNGTTLSSTGLLSFATDETGQSVAVVATSNTDKSYNGIGTVNVAASDSSS